jgi:hypothetical protein
VDHLELFASLGQQIAAALAALPHDYDEAAQRLLGVQNQLAVLEAEGERDLEAMARWYDDGGSVEVVGGAE